MKQLFQYLIREGQSIWAKADAKGNPILEKKNKPLVILHKQFRSAESKAKFNEVKTLWKKRSESILEKNPSHQDYKQKFVKLIEDKILQNIHELLKKREEYNKASEDKNPIGMLR